MEYAYPTVSKTAPYEYVQNSPASVYTELDTNKRHETANENTYQKLLKYNPDYVIPADGDDETKPYEEVGKEKTPPGYTELDTNQRHETTNENTYQKLLKCNPDYTIPADDDDETKPYEEVGKQKTPPGYTELDTNKRHETANENTYQKLLKYNPDYTIPADDDDETKPYEEVGKQKTPPGYTELDTNKRHETANENTYQKLLKYNPDYVIPADGDDETKPYEEAGKEKTPLDT